MAFAAGSIWISDQCHGTIERIDARRMRIIATIPLRERHPGRIAATQNAVWVSNLSPDTSRLRTISRIDPASDRVVKTIRFRQNIPYIRGGQDVPVPVAGELWVPSGYAGQTIARISTQTNRVVGKVRVGAGAADMAVDGNSVWVSTLQSARLVHLLLR
jgi:DNA-binding beta-propeller fold protein YncE